MSWKDNISFDNESKLLYNGIDIGVSREFIQDLITNGIACDDDLIFKDFESRYNSKICIIRNKKIDEILSS